MMNKKKHNHFIIIFLQIFCFFQLLEAQNTLRIGEWQSYLPYQSSVYATQSSEEVFFATPFSIVAFDKEDGSTRFLEKTNVLNDVSPRVIKYNQKNKTLFVAYENSNIDLVSENETVNVNYIQKNINISGNKIVYDAFMSGDTAYLACGFGMTALHLGRKEFLYTTFFPRNVVYSLTIFQNKIVAATQNGLYAVENNPRQINLSDFNNWKKLDTSLGLPPQYGSRVATVAHGKLYFDCNDTLKVWAGNATTTTQTVHYNDDFYFKYLTFEGQKLVAGQLCKSGCNGKALLIDANNNLQDAPFGCIFQSMYALQDEKNNFWAADLWFGCLKGKPNEGCNILKINSPNSPNAFDIAIAADGTPWVTYGGVSGINPMVSAAGFGRFQGGSWKNFNRGTHPILSDSAADLDFFKVAISPKTNRVFVGTYYGGIIELEKDNIVKIYTDKNSALQEAQGDPTRERIGGLAFDKNDNLWISNSFAINSLVVRKADGTWQRMNSSIPRQTFQIVIDDADNKWVVTTSGILVYNENKTIDNLNDDRFIVIDGSNSVLGKMENPSIRCLAKDLDGKIWVGTSNGVAVFECGSDPIRNRCVGRQIVASLNGILENLLRQQSVQAIAVDGANRKWFGTTNGIFVQSADGTTEVAKYNIENSPLPSNNIMSLQFDARSGGIWVGTAKGLVLLRSDATEGGKVNSDTAYAFPNPVRPDYEGTIAIRGLARDATVKIMDVNGRLVFETRALGGQAIWNGRNLTNQKVSSGVYFVFASNKDIELSEAIVTKILFINN